MALLSTLRAKADAGEKTFTVEISPPANYKTMVKTDEMVRALKDFDIAGIAVTNSTGGSFRMNPLSVVETIRAWRPETPIVIHLTARDEGSIRSVYSRADEMNRKAVSDVLILRGDPTPHRSREVDAFKFSTVELVRLIRDYRDEQGYAIDIFVAGHPEYPAHALSKHMAYQRQKVESGADGIIANIITDPTNYVRYVEAALAQGIAVPILPSVIPLTSVRRCLFLQTSLHIPVPRWILERLDGAKSKEEVVRLGIELTIGIVEHLLRAGAPGVNFNLIFPQDIASVAEILRAVRGYATIWEKYKIEDPEEIEYYSLLRGRLS
ncbi:MAG: methylenetetrahydrofolate reductase [Blastocatellia bacterium]|nr:methylenetetrahydrofolate reductase [Blastocatellia bacterium]MCS7156728.1 methylenetetrahydrofolate reductase [Blastocatellia bacterium]MCX7751530.1 methylenetetrahydrofolate reductase [Blastocatellia bacterium]MDW8168630.1 methylenetetrahydrofolate reductase [Acidobacteriota bacterium]MDW8256525.1 methylenetetrahydrofolate reductase [Acidobacteriota bacterium]